MGQFLSCGIAKSIFVEKASYTKEEILKNAPIILEKFKLLLSHTPTPDKQIPEGYINVHGHIHNKSLYDCIEKYNPSMYTITRHINVSCDVTDFTPISIEKLL